MRVFCPFGEWTYTKPCGCEDRIEVDASDVFSVSWDDVMF